MLDQKRRATGRRMDPMTEPYIEVPGDPEVPEADAMEQLAALDDEDESELPPELPEDADEGDAIEQVREVRLDEDEYL